MAAGHAIAFVTEVPDEAQLAPHDRPDYSLYAAEELTLSAKEGFCFSADVPTACYHFQVAHLSGIAGLGVDVFVRILVKDGYDWARPWAKDWTLSPLGKGKAGSSIVRLSQPAVLEVFIWHDGHARGAKLKIGISGSVRKEAIHPRRSALEKLPLAAVRLWATPTPLCSRPEPLAPSPSTAGVHLLDDRRGHSVAAYGDVAYVFGGEADGTLTNDLLVVDYNGTITKYEELLDGRAGAHSFTGVPPVPRAGHTCVVWAGKLCYFGGFSLARSPPRSGRRWKPSVDPAQDPDPFPTPAVVGTLQPPPRLEPASWEEEAHPLLDVFLFDPKAQMWSSPSLLQGDSDDVDHPLLPRAHHTAVVYTDSMFVFGGCIDACLAKKHEPGGWIAAPLWQYHLAQRRWQALSPSGAPYDGRVYGHSATVLQGCMYVFGGVTPKGYSDQLWCMSLQNMTWAQVITSGPPPAPRAFSCFLGLQCTRGTSANGPDVYPVPQLLDPDLGPGHTLTCCVLYGGNTRRKAVSTDAVNVLLLQDFRGHEALRWLSHPVADRAWELDASESRPDLPLPGPAALLCVQHRLRAMFIGQPLLRSGDVATPSLLLFPGMVPHDHSACVTHPGTSSRGDPFRNPVALALSELEQQLRLLKAQMKLAAQLSLAPDHPEMRQAYVFACMDLSEHVHRCEDCCQRIPPQKRGSKGDDLLAMLDTLKGAAALMIEEAQSSALAGHAAETDRGRTEALGDMYHRLRSPTPEVMSGSLGGPPPPKVPGDDATNPSQSTPSNVPPWTSPRISPRPQPGVAHPRTISISTASSSHGPWPPAEWTAGTDASTEANVRRLTELLRAQVRCVRLLQETGPSAAHALEYAHACQALSDIVQQGAVACLELPAGGFGSATEDLAMTYDVLANQAHVILTDCPPDVSLLSSLPPHARAPLAMDPPSTSTHSLAAPSVKGAVGSSTAPTPSNVVAELEEALTLLDRQLISLKKQRQRAHNWLLFRSDITRSQAFIKQLVARCTELAGRVPSEDAAGQALLQSFGLLLHKVKEDLSA